MSFSDIPTWVYVAAIWYVCGIWAVGALFAGMVCDRKPLPTTGRYWVWVVAIFGLPLFIYVWLGCKDLGKGFVLTDRAAERLKNRLQRK